MCYLPGDSHLWVSCILAHLLSWRRLCSGLSFKDMCIADSLGRQRQCLLEATGTRGPAHHERWGLPEPRVSFLSCNPPGQFKSLWELRLGEATQQNVANADASDLPRGLMSSTGIMKLWWGSLLALQKGKISHSSQFLTLSCRDSVLCRGVFPWWSSCVGFSGIFVCLCVHVNFRSSSSSSQS